MAAFTDADTSRLTSQLKQSEGFRLEAYRCTSGALTIGYGHNCDASPVDGVSRVGDRITREVAEQLFEADLAAAVWAVRRALPWVAELSAPRQAVLYDMCFNMGIGSAKTRRGLLSFVNSLQMVQRGEYARAAENILDSNWARQVKSRAVRLSRQMALGEWQ